MDMKKIQKIKFEVARGPQIKYRTYHVDAILDPEDIANKAKIVVCTERVDQNKVKVGAAFCSPLDNKNFVRKFGQHTAYERIKKGKGVEVDLSQRPDGITVHDYLKSAILELSGDIRWMHNITTADLI